MNEAAGPGWVHRFALAGEVSSGSTSQNDLPDGVFYFVQVAEPEGIGLSHGKTRWVEPPLPEGRGFLGSRLKISVSTPA
jgi:hypothetical protein